MQGSFPHLAWKSLVFAVLVDMPNFQSGSRDMIMTARVEGFSKARAKCEPIMVKINKKKARRYLVYQRNPKTVMVYFCYLRLCYCSETICCRSDKMRAYFGKDKLEKLS